jgi:hypothetical protein
MRLVRRVVAVGLAALAGFLVITVLVDPRQALGMIVALVLAILASAVYPSSRNDAP